jgi:NAD+ synthase
MISSIDLKINCSVTKNKITNFIHNYIKNSGLEGAVVAVSGGIDSAVALQCAVYAIGNEKVIAIHMPERDITPKSDTLDVMQHCKELDVTCNIVDVTEMLHVMQKGLPFFDSEKRIIYGNVKSRLRMIVSYYFANNYNRIVLGTSNKTELLTGFFTKYGDGGVDLLPLADLYKTQIRQLAEYFKIPENIINKPPSPGFFPGHTDEDELGIDYFTLDQILYSLEREKTKEEISEKLKLPIIQIEEVVKRVESNKHKREFPLILRLS